MATVEVGEDGLKRAISRGDLIVIIDTLSFSSAVVTGIAHGYRFMCAHNLEQAEALARDHDARVAVSARGGGIRGKFSLSPISYLNLRGNNKLIALPSPNGSTFCRLAQGRASVLIGTFLNANAIARYALKRMSFYGIEQVSMVACGERTEEGERRFAVEDYLGAGAILSELRGIKMSIEAAACRASYEGVANRLQTMLSNSESGQELKANGRGMDALFAAQMNLYDIAPNLYPDGVIAE